MSNLFNEWYVYHQNNPRVYRLVCEFAAAAIRAGHENYGLATIWERIRWEITVNTDDVNFKMPNNHRAYYARLWLKDHPEYLDFFRTAELRSLRGNAPVDRYGRTL
jgi:hypothetical protein